MATADIYRQYLTDYEDAAKKYNRSSRAYSNSLQLQGGPVKAKDSGTGQEYGLWNMPSAEVQRVTTNPDGSKSVRTEQQSGAVFVPQDTGWRGETSSGWYRDLGNGVAARLTGGKPTGQYVTDRIEGAYGDAQLLRESGRFKDVTLVNEPTIDADGNTTPGAIDVTYEQMRFPDAPGEFKEKQPSLSLAQMREIQNPTPTMADAEREGIEDKGLIESARNKFMSAKPGLISSSR